MMKEKNWILAIFICLKFALQYFLLSPEYDLQRDEYLHLDQAHHLAWGYLSVPPFTSWISGVIYLLGNGIFWVKFFPALFGALTILVVWKAIEALKGTLFALILGATGVLFSVLLRLNTLYQPNSFDVLCWTALYFTILRYFESEKPKWLFASAFIFALGFLNKYTILFLLMGLIPAILLGSQRKIFIKKELYLALSLGIVLISPNLLWQYHNHFPVIAHMEELAETQLVHVDRIGFLRSQVFFFIGSLIVLISALCALFFYVPFQKYRPFLGTFFFTIMIFMYFKAKDYYAIGLYPIYIAFGSVFLDHILNTGWKKHLRPVLVALPILFFVPMWYFMFPNKSPEYMVEHSATYKKLGMLRWEDGKDHLIPQDYADMLGWQELAAKVDSTYKTIPNPRNTLILCDNYGQAGAINYYTTQGVKAVSFNADYVNWFDLGPKYMNLIRVKSNNEKEDELKKTGAHFSTAVLVDSITNPYAREFKTTILVFTGAKVDVNKRIRSEIVKAKNHYR